MVFKREYSKVVEGKTASSTLKMNQSEFNNECEYKCLVALVAISERHDYDAAKRILEEVALVGCSKLGKGLYKEAQLILKLREGKELDRLIYLADEIIEINPESAFARSFKGYLAIRLGNPKVGIDYYLEIIRDYPQAYWVYHQMVRFLFENNQVKESRPYISNIRPRSIRCLYYLGNFFFSSRLNFLYFFLDFVIGLVSNSITATLPFLGIPVILTIYAFIKREVSLYKKFFICIVQGIVVTYLISLS
ncbi:MAG: hypothetical protein ABFS17_04170 [Chloroflexota bacterium]